MSLDRRAVMAELVRNAGGMLVVAGLGSTTYDLGAAGDRAENLYLWGAMGGAAMIGLGLALAQPARRVLVATGDGEALMGMGALATMASAGAANLAMVVLDNRRFGETGGQASHTGLGTDLCAVAAGCGWRATARARTMADVAALRPRLRAEALFAVVEIAGEEVERFLPQRDGTWIARRLRGALGIAPD